MENNNRKETNVNELNRKIWKMILFSNDPHFVHTRQGMVEKDVQYALKVIHGQHAKNNN